MMKYVFDGAGSCAQSRPSHSVHRTAGIALRIAIGLSLVGFPAQGCNPLKRVTERRTIPYENAIAVYGRDVHL